MAIQAGELRAGAALPEAPERLGPPLVVVVSSRTAQVLSQVLASGWSGPVLLVGTVGEAQQVVDAEGPGARPETPEPTDHLGILLDRHRQCVVCGDRDVALTPLEFGVLEALSERPGHVRRFDDLTRRVWGSTHVGDGGQVHAVVARVRRKLDLVHAPVDLLAVRGVGFRLVAHPRAGTTEGPPRLSVAD